MAQVDPSTVLVRIGEENAHEALTGASFVSVGYGSAEHAPRRARGRRPHPHGLSDEHGRGSRRGPLRRPPAGRELRLNFSMATDYFGVLGVARNASDNDIKRAYRKMARDLHPDVNPDPGAKERFQEVTRAYEALTDPEKRRIVDLGGDPFDNGSAAGGAASAAPGSVASATSWTRSSAAPRPAGPAAAPAPGATRSSRSSSSSTRRSSGRRRTSPSTPPSSAPSARARAPRPAPTRRPARRARAAARCRASSAASSARSSPAGCAPPAPVPARSSPSRAPSAPATVGPLAPHPQVKVPAGVEDGMRIRLTGQGEVGPGGGPAGDLYVEIHERPHDVFTRTARTCTAGSRCP